MPHKDASTQRHNQQVLVKTRHSPSDRDQQARQKLQQKSKNQKLSLYSTRGRYIKNCTQNISTRSTSYFTLTGFNRLIIKFKRKYNPHPVCDSRRFELFRNDRLFFH